MNLPGEDPEDPAPVDPNLVETETEEKFKPVGVPVKGKPGQHLVNIYGAQFKDENVEAAYKMDEKIRKMISIKEPTHLNMLNLRELYTSVLEAIMRERKIRKTICCLPATV